MTRPAPTHPTDCPGVVAVKGYRDYQLVAELHRSPVIATRLGDGRDPARFARLRDAKAAAARLAEADVLPWDDPELPAQLRDLAPPERDRIRRAIVSALIGEPLGQAEDRFRREREQARREHTGEAQRDREHAAASELGHDLTWKRSGSRSWRGRCRACRGEVRVSYQSMAGRHSVDGLRTPCTPDK